MRHALIALIVLLGIVGMPGLITAQKKAQSGSRPTLFEPEDHNHGLEGARHPSDNVLDALLKRVENDELSSEIEELSRERKRALFEVVRVNLGPTSEEDYVVHGKPPLIGADCEWFWIVRVREKKAEVMLFSNGLALQLQRQLVSGYRDIDVSWATAAYVGNRLYRYDGSTYKLLREHTEEQKP
jgi:hypothetical protein